MVDYYRIFGVPSEASPEEIHAAYRRTAKRCHPDMGGSHQAMVEVIAGWAVLSDPGRRAVYDAARRSDAAAAQASWQSVRERAARTASAVAANEGRSWEQFVAWVERAASDADRNPAGRGLAGAAVGSVIGGVLGAVIGNWIGLDAVSGGAAGAVAGAVGGFLAGKNRGVQADKR